MVVVTIGCPSRVDAVEGAVNLVLWRNNLEKLSEGRLFGISFEKTEESCVKRRRKMNLEILATGREMGELENTTKTWEYFWNLKRPK